MSDDTEIRFGDVDYEGTNVFAALRIGDDPGEPPDLVL